MVDFMFMAFLLTFVPAFAFVRSRRKDKPWLETLVGACLISFTVAYLLANVADFIKNNLTDAQTANATAPSEQVSKAVAELNDQPSQENSIPTPTVTADGNAPVDAPYTSRDHCEVQAWKDFSDRTTQLDREYQARINNGGDLSNEGADYQDNNQEYQAELTQCRLDCEQAAGGEGC